ncbi:MAG: Mlc titration factor MtfA (ptsG expression regulator) [Pseudoalteromonas tetraodonis]|jgi:Mlc titration factor MtfA (ptsG expression regulator)
MRDSVLDRRTMSNILREHHRAKLRAQPFPESWLPLLARHFPLYGVLPEEDRAELRGHIQVFLDEKSFEGCGGLEITDEIRLAVAAQACLLLLHRDTDYYPRLRSILVYPQHFLATGVRRGEDGLVHQRGSTLLGESWRTGSVILSWESVRHGGENSQDGENVVFHEFAHQLDIEDGSVDGSPALGDGLRFTERRSKYVSWARVMRVEYELLQFFKSHHRKSLLSHYGATNPAEFFAVATETFFEKPKQMLKQHPELYAELQDYFEQHPASW